MLKSAGAAAEPGAGDYARQLRRALVQKAEQIAGRGLGCFRPFHFSGRRRRGVVVGRTLHMDHALVNLLHRFQVRVQLV